MVIEPKRDIALVTGGIGGIGTAIAEELHRVGYRVVVNYIEFEWEQARAWIKRHKDCEYTATVGDVSSWDDMVSMAGRIEDNVGPVDVLVNCAGITKDTTLAKMEPDQWNEVIDINLTGMFNVTRQFIPSMLARRKGRVINISSVNGQQGAFGQTNYGAAKAGVHGFTMSLAREVARKGITVNTISPGYIDTPMTAAIPGDIREKIIKTIPMGRMGTPEDIANLVGFLVSSKADYITGADLSVNGGLNMG